MIRYFQQSSTIPPFCRSAIDPSSTVRSFSEGGCSLDPYIMNQHIARIALVVKDYDEAIQFYTQKLDFELIEDTVLSETKRWVVVAPPGSMDACCLLLAKAANEEQRSRIGNQTGGRVFLFLYTDDFRRDYNRMVEKGIHFVRPPVEETYGTVAVFEDLYGNLWDFIQPRV
jgi:catechol 2,3-dioxygenase-like lactoylglutathione lyase family enzyme